MKKEAVAYMWFHYQLLNMDMECLPKVCCVVCKSLTRIVLAYTLYFNKKCFIFHGCDVS